MVQQGQVFQLASRNGEARWAYRYRVGGRGSKRVQRGGFATEQASLAMIDRRYGHLARDGREHAIRLLDTFAGAAQSVDVHAVDAAWTLERASAANAGNEKGD
jgi:hypothetical protein